MCKHCDFKDIEVIKDFITFQMANDATFQSDYIQSLREIVKSIDSILLIDNFHPDEVTKLIKYYENNTIYGVGDEVDTRITKRKVNSLKWIEGFYRGYDL